MKNKDSLFIRKKPCSYAVSFFDYTKVAKSDICIILLIYLVILRNTAKIENDRKIERVI